MSGTVVSDPNRPNVSAWRALRTETAASLVDTRLQVHHAAQLATALGISYLPKQPDDSHTNLMWIDALSALVSNPVRNDADIRVGVTIAPFAVLVIANDGPRANLSLDGRTIAEAADWVRQHVATLGLDPTNKTRARITVRGPLSLTDEAGGTVVDAGAIGVGLGAVRAWPNANCKGGGLPACIKGN